MFDVTVCPVRLRPDIPAMEEGNLDLAASEKRRLEEKQRDARGIMAKRGEEWQARYVLTSRGSGGQL